MPPSAHPHLRPYASLHQRSLPPRGFLPPNERLATAPLSRASLLPSRPPRRPTPIGDGPHPEPAPLIPEDVGGPRQLKWPTVSDGPGGVKLGGVLCQSAVARRQPGGGGGGGFYVVAGVGLNVLNSRPTRSGPAAARAQRAGHAKRAVRPQ